MEDFVDWAVEELPEVFTMIGPAAVPALAEFLQKRASEYFITTTAAHALASIGQQYPEVRDQCVAAITERLQRHDDNDEALNGFLIGDLAFDLKAMEALPVIREVFAQGNVDEMISGDLEDVEIRMGVREQRSKPRRPLSELMPEVVRSAVAPAQPNWSKVGRNDPCPCGSGVKFKKCCLKKQQKAAH